MNKERVTLTLSPAVWSRTKRYARERGTSASALVGAALEAMLAQAETDLRIQAAQEIAEMDLPIATPEQLEREILDGMLRDDMSDVSEVAGA